MQQNVGFSYVIPFSYTFRKKPTLSLTCTISFVNLRSEKYTEPMSKEYFISLLSPYLFWDIDLDVFDAENNSRQLIQRVLEYGQLEDWKLLCDYYGLERIVSDCKAMRTMDPKALSFVCAISGTNKEDYRCYTMRQYTQRHWSY